MHADLASMSLFMWCFVVVGCWGGAVSSLQECGTWKAIHVPVDGPTLMHVEAVERTLWVWKREIEMDRELMKLGESVVVE